MTDDLVIQFAKRFIQRRDVKAVQFANGAYSPDRELKNLGEHAPLGFTIDHVEAHLSGAATYGHYLLDADDQCRMFALDIDLRKTPGHWCPLPNWRDVDPDITDEAYTQLIEPVETPNPREVWADRTQVEARNWYKFQMGSMARTFAGIITRQLELPCAVAYSGNKGIHVYGFTGPVPASDARAAAVLTMELAEGWEIERGQHMFKSSIADPFMGFPDFSIETFPKQDSLQGKDLGNLMRLPLGRNLKSQDPTFFIDLNTPAAVMAPHRDPVKLLETGNPFCE